MRLGNTNLRLVSDGEHWMDGAGMFGLVPKIEWREMAEPDEQNRVRTQLYCLLIETEEQKILVDTGYGDKLSDQEREFIRLEGDGRLLASLAASGVAPEDVDMVINTHLHGDHCGGNTRYNEKGDLVPTFPNALYYVQRIELADAMFPNQRTRGTYHRENLDSVERAGQLRVLWGDTRLTEEVRVLVTPGHTPAHQCVVIESEGEMALFLASLRSLTFILSDQSFSGLGGWARLPPTLLGDWAASRPSLRRWTLAVPLPLPQVATLWRMPARGADP